MKLSSGDVAVITGASGGIGRATAERLARVGMRLALADVDADRLARTADELRSHGASVIHAAVDVSQPEDLDALRDQVLDAFGSVTILMNNAGIGACGRVWELKPETWRAAVDVNVLGVVNGLRSFVPTLIGQNRGHIVNTASMAGLVAKPLFSPYVATKFAVAGLTESLYHELAEVAPGVGVSLLCPGPVATQFLSLDRLASDHDGGGDDDVATRVAVAAHQVTTEQGIDPSEVAECVLEGIVAGRFYLLTHPNKAVEVARRADDIVNDRSPTLTVVSA